MKKKYLILLCLLLCKVFIVSAQNEKFKALFIYNYTKYIEWPTSQRDGDFVIGVLGNSTLADELKTISQKQKVGNRNIVVKVFSTADEIDNCHILFIASGKSSALPSAIQKSSGRSTLIITDKDGLARQGACINFVTDGSKLNYEISKQNIEKNGLSVSSSLLSLGKPVE